MSDIKKVLEDENIEVEYNIVNGLVCIDKIYLKEAKTEEVEDKPLTRYEYPSVVTGLTLSYSDFKKDEFILKISGSNIPTLGVQRLVVWVSEEYIDKVEILEDSTGLHVYLDNFLAEGETFTKEFFDAFSKEILFTIVDVRNDGLIEFCGSIANQYSVENYENFKKLIRYMNEALI